MVYWSEENVLLCCCWSLLSPEYCFSASSAQTRCVLPLQTVRQYSPDHPPSARTTSEAGLTPLSVSFRGLPCRWICRRSIWNSLTRKSSGRSVSTPIATFWCSYTRRRRAGRRLDGTWRVTRWLACLRRVCVSSDGSAVSVETVVVVSGCSAGTPAAGRVACMPTGPNYMTVCRSTSTNLRATNASEGASSPRRFRSLIGLRSVTINSLIPKYC